MIAPQVHVVAILALATVASMACYSAGGRLKIAGLTLLGSFMVVLWGQLVLGLVAPSLTVLTAFCDMVSLGVIGWTLIKARQRTGLHVAGIAMCVSLMSHVAYHVAGIGHNATLAYFLVTNTSMVIACLGLFVTGLQRIAGNGLGGGIYRYHGSSVGGHSRVAARHKGRS